MIIHRNYTTEWYNVSSHFNVRISETIKEACYETGTGQALI